MNQNEDNSDNEEICLPNDTLAILQQFLREKEEREKFENECLTDKNKKANFEENWQLSQFWYNETTKKELAKVCEKLVKVNGKEVDTVTIGLFSCPSLYFYVKEIHSNVKIFEFDRRFESYGSDFVFYDYNKAGDDYLTEYENHFDILIIDPPFLSEECIDKISKIVKKITTESSKIILCSGNVVKDWSEKYMNLKKYKFKPEHERNLGNEFAAFANFNLDNFCC